MIQIDGVEHNSGLEKLAFSFGAQQGYSVNGLYADVQFNWAAGAYATTDYNTYSDWFATNVAPHPVITPLEIDLGVIAMKAVQSAIHDVPKVEYPDEYAHQDEYSVYGWVQWADNID